MASSSRIFCLSLGFQTIRFAEFQSDNRGGLILRSYRTSELLADPATDATRVGQTALAVQELAGAAKAAGQSVNYSIPAQSVFTRFVRLPSVGEEKIDQIVEFEAQQNVPFPIEEVVWDYQLVSSHDTSKLEVVLVAIKADLLEELNGAVESASVRTGVVDVAPMALYNAFRYNYSDIEGCSLLIDIGARTTNLLFIESKKVFSRSIPIGGNTITAAIAKDFSEPFTAAEERKKRNGFVSLGGAYAEPEDPEVARVSKVIRNTMTRLHAEISRSISFYRSQQGGNQPERVFLCGGAVAMPYMREFFSEKLALPIEFLNPLRNVAVGSDVDAASISRDAHLLGELVGLGLRSGSNCPMELNLRPASVIRVQQMAARRPYLVTAGVCLLLLLGGWWLYFHKAAAVQKTAFDALTPKIAALKSLEGQFSAAKAQITAKQASVAPLIQAVADREYWIKLIDDLNTRLPEKWIWVTSFEMVTAKAAPARPAPRGAHVPATPPHQELVIKGLYLQNQEKANVVDEFLKNLAGSPFYAIDLAKRTEINPVRQPQTDTEWTFSYELRLPLKNPHAL